MLRLTILSITGLATGDTEASSLLQTSSSRDNALLKRSQMSQKLSNLEENLMGKGGGVDRAKCTYYSKYTWNNVTSMHKFGMTPCDQLKLLEKTFKGSMKDFRDYAKTSNNIVDDVLDVFKKGADANLEDAQKQFSQALDKLTTSIRAVNGGPLGSEFSEAFDNFNGNVKTALRAVVQETVSTFEGAEGAECANLECAPGIAQDFELHRRNIYREVEKFWREVLRSGEEVEHWPSWHDMKPEKLFWPTAKGYLDAVDHVESDCKSAAFEKEEDFALRKICKSNDKPRCLDEFLYLAAEAGIDDTTACAEVDSSWSDSALATELDFMTDAGICKKVQDLRKACKTIVKEAAKKSVEAAKKSARATDLLNAAMKSAHGLAQVGPGPR